MNELVKALEEMCELIDEFAKNDIAEGTPLYNFQQGMIANVKRYREKNKMSNDAVYPLYKLTKRLIEKTQACDENHSEEDLFKEWKDAIKCFDSLDRGYAERYQREKDVIASFTQDQINHICYQIGDWYLMMKPLLEGTHNLGHMKEKLKVMICGD